jgi:hypothetical protein
MPQPRISLLLIMFDILVVALAREANLSIVGSKFLSIRIYQN